MSDQKNLRIFCPVHEAVFEAPDAPKILCEITGHALSSDFPHAESWEFCCNCDTFSPSKLGKGESARSTCFSCQNDISKRFICTSCKTVSFAGEKSSKGQVYFISAEGIGPSCPGCGTLEQQKTLILHDCTDAKAEFFTALESCPFCLEKTSVGFILPDKPRANIQNNGCPNCHAVNPPSALFCGKCRERLRFDVDVANPGTEISMTRLFGSLCPNCSTPIIRGFPFCGECGQAVKTPGTAAPPPPPPSPQESITVNYGSTDLSGTAGPEPTMNRIPLVVGGLVVLALVIIVGVSIGGRSGGSSGNNSSSSTPRPTPLISGTPNTSNRDYRIGKTGRLTTDMNLRATPGATDPASWVGTQYRNAKVRILDIQTITDPKGTPYDWFRIQVTEYGQSADANNAGRSKNPDSLDVGWINSFPNVYFDNSTTQRRIESVAFDK